MDICLVRLALRNVYWGWGDYCECSVMLTLYKETSRLGTFKMMPRNLNEIARSWIGLQLFFGFYSKFVYELPAAVTHYNAIFDPRKSPDSNNDCEVLWMVLDFFVEHFAALLWTWLPRLFTDKKSVFRPATMAPTKFLYQRLQGKGKSSHVVKKCPPSSQCTDGSMCVLADGSWRIGGIMRWDCNCVRVRVSLSTNRISN